MNSDSMLQNSSPGAVRVSDERDVPYIGDLRTIPEVITFLRRASESCSETAKHITGEDAVYLQGRAHAFGLAAGWVEDVIRRGAE